MVAGHSAPHSAPPSVVTSHPVPQLVHSFSPHSEFGPPQLTDFLEMPLDWCVNIVTAMINDGRSVTESHVLKVRQRGELAEDQPLGFFPRSSRSRTRRSPVSRGKQHSDLHCEATPAPSFPSWTFVTLTSLPSRSQVGEPQPPLAPTLPAPFNPPPPSSPCAPFLCQRTPQPVPPPPLPQPSSPCTPHRCQGCQELISLVVGSPFNSRLFKPRFIAWLAQLPLHLLHALRPPSPSPCASLQYLFTPGVHCWPPLLTDFASVVAACLPCLRSAPWVTVTLTVTVSVLTTAFLFLSPSLLLLPRALLAHTAHVVHQVALLHLMLHPLDQSEVLAQTLSPFSTAPLPTSCCNLHCTSPCCVVHDPLSLSEGAARR